MQYGLALEVVEQLDLSSVRSVLDVGCGSGRVTAEIARRCRDACVLGVDLSAEMVAFAGSRYAAPNLAFAQDDAAALSLSDRFDLITSFACLHWLRDPARAVSRMAREHLRPGGLLRAQFGGEGNMSNFMQGVERLRFSLRWRAHFEGFEFPWSFWGLEPFRQAMEGLQVERLELIHRTGALEGTEDFKRWFEAGWRPYVNRLGPDLDVFLEELLEGHQGPVEVPMVRVDLAVRAGG